MHLSFIRVWILTIACAYGNVLRNKMAANQSEELDDFFDHIEKSLPRLMDDYMSKGIFQTDPKKERYTSPEDTVAKKTSYDQLQANVADDLRSQHVDSNNDIYSSVETDKKEIVSDFEGYQEFLFQPLYPCDRYDAASRYCVFFRQLGTTLTLGMEVGEGIRKGVRIYWYRCLKKKHSHHHTREPINIDFLPWNLNLGRSETELRISPVTETDLSDNYYVAELDIPRSYSGKYGMKPTMRFSIEPINIDMGPLYHGEEIIVYARSYMEVPRTSVSFLWSLYDMNDFEDHGLPSNMRLNSEKSTVIIKEWKTDQSYILSCRVYSNKNVLLARRNFLFRESGNQQKSEKSNPTRRRRDTEERELDPEFYDPDLTVSSGADTKPNVRRMFDAPPEIQNLFQVKVPPIQEDLFYVNPKSDRPYFEDRIEPQSRPLRSKILPFFPFQHPIPDSSRRLVQREMHGRDSVDSKSIEVDVLVNQNQPEETVRFEDKDSQSIATCGTNYDCNIYAICTRASFSGQNFCKCRHGYNGNGIFCLNS